MPDSGSSKAVDGAEDGAERKAPDPGAEQDVDDPNDPEVKWEAAKEEAAKVIALNPTSASAYLEAGMILDRSQQPREAITYLRRAVALAPRQAVHYDMLGAVYRNAATSITSYVSHKKGPSAEALPPPERMPGGDDPCWKRQVPTCFELRHYTNEQLHIAEEDFLRRIKQDDQDHHGFGLLKQLYRNLSTTACVTALRLEPTRATAYLTLARLLPKGGALKLYEHALTLVPSRPGLYREFGDSLRDLRYFGQANTAYRTSITLAPTSHLGYESLAKLRLLRHRPEEAVSIAADYLSTQPDAPDPPTAASASNAVASRAASSTAAAAMAAAIALMSEARCEQVRFDEAAALARSAIAIDASSARAYVHLGRALYTHLGDLGPLPIGYHDKGLSNRADAHAAIKVCTVAAKLMPEDAATQYRLGTLLRRIPGRLQEAIDHFNRCLLVNMSYPGAKEANEEAVKRMREAQRPRRDWQALFANLPALVMLGAMTRFLMN